MDGFIRDPHVSVFVKEYNSKKVFVIGQVQRPGTFPFEERMNIVQAITQAGGFTPTAARDRTLVTRTIDGREVQIPVPVDRIATGEAVNFPLAPGDIVFVPEGIL
jgi:polysaccharide export outer membrane protein